MRRFAVVVGFLSLCSLAWAARQPAPEPTPAPPRAPAAITWHSYEEAVALAKQSGKATLVEFRAEWCTWCKKMEKEVYTHRDVIALSEWVVFARVDEGQRRDLMRQYGVRGLPTAVLLERNGREIKRIVGYKAAPEFATEIRQALAK